MNIVDKRGEVIIPPTYTIEISERELDVILALSWLKELGGDGGKVELLGGYVCNGIRNGSALRDSVDPEVLEASRRRVGY